MSVISLTITQSSEETVSGIPNTISISSNVPSIIFYTLDGSSPTAYSPVYTHSIELPSYLPSLTLNVLATDGTSNSSVYTQTFTADLSSIVNLTQGAQVSQATVASIGNPANNNSLFPFGTPRLGIYDTITGRGNPDKTLLNESLPSSPNAFDADGNPTSFTNQPLDPFGYPPKAEDKNVRVIGDNGPPKNPQEASNNDKLFNPKALVIYHDASNTDPLVPKIINRAAFSLENSERTKDGILLSTTGLDSPTITGSFIKSHYNPNTGEMTTYYRDSSVNRWIISTWKYSPTSQSTGSFTNLVFGRGDGSRFVYPWHLWARRTLM